MLSIGYSLMSICFLYGSYLCSLDQTTVDWTFFSIAMVVGSIGVCLIVLSKKGHAKKMSQNLMGVTELELCLKRIVDHVSNIQNQSSKVSPYKIRFLIDETMLTDLDLFIHSRKTIAYVYDLQLYADVVSEFACAERYLNRVWSASADGYIDEVNSYLEMTKDQFQQAYQKLCQAHK